MKIFLLAMVAICCVASCSPATRIYFVRHAEKGAEPVGDPDLSAAGKARAAVLADLLSDKSIRTIYVTETRRSHQTAAPLSARISVPLTTYTHDTVHRFLFQLLEADRNALVVGHSNTVLAMLRELGLKPARLVLGEDDYDGLWMVSQRQREGRGGFRLILRERNYGAKSMAAGDTSRRAARSAAAFRSPHP